MVIIDLRKIGRNEYMKMATEITSDMVGMVKNSAIKGEDGEWNEEVETEGRGE